MVFGGIIELGELLLLFPLCFWVSRHAWQWPPKMCGVKVAPEGGREKFSARKIFVALIPCKWTDGERTSVQYGYSVAVLAMWLHSAKIRNVYVHLLCLLFSHELEAWQLRQVVFYCMGTAVHCLPSMKHYRRYRSAHLLTTKKLRCKCF